MILRNAGQVDRDNHAGHIGQSETFIRLSALMFRSARATTQPLLRRYMQRLSISSQATGRWKPTCRNPASYFFSGKLITATAFKPAAQTYSCLPSRDRAMPVGITPRSVSSVGSGPSLILLSSFKVFASKICRVSLLELVTSSLSFVTKRPLGELPPTVLPRSDVA